MFPSHFGLECKPACSYHTLSITAVARHLPDKIFSLSEDERTKQTVLITISGKRERLVLILHRQGDGAWNTFIYTSKKSKTAAVLRTLESCLPRQHKHTVFITSLQQWNHSQSHSFLHCLPDIQLQNLTRHTSYIYIYYWCSYIIFLYYWLDYSFTHNVSHALYKVQTVYIYTGASQ